MGVKVLKIISLAPKWALKCLANISTLALLICSLLYILITFNNAQYLNDNFWSYQSFKSFI